MKLKRRVVFMSRNELTELVDLLLDQPNCEFEDIKLKRILVYLKDDHLYQIADAIASGRTQWPEVKKMYVYASNRVLHRLIEGMENGINIPEYWKMYVHLSKEDAAYMLEVLLKRHLDPHGIAVFVPSWGFTRIVDMYEEGLIEESVLDKMYVFMKDEDVRRVMLQSIRNRSTMGTPIKPVEKTHIEAVTPKRIGMFFTHDEEDVEDILENLEDDIEEMMDEAEDAKEAAEDAREDAKDAREEIEEKRQEVQEALEEYERKLKELENVLKKYDDRKES